MTKWYWNCVTRIKRNFRAYAKHVKNQMCFLWQMGLWQWLAILMLFHIIVHLYVPYIKHRITQCIYNIYIYIIIINIYIYILCILYHIAQCTFFGFCSAFLRAEMFTHTNSPNSRTRPDSEMAWLYHHAKNHRMSTSTWTEFWLANFWQKSPSIGNQNKSR